MNDLLDDPIFTLEHPDGRRDARSLPGVLAALGRSERVEFAALRPHQSHAWHAFLVQLAALVLHRAPDHPLGDEGAWRRALLELGQGNPNAWRLVVDDTASCAFFQVPLSAATAAKLGDAYDTPDASSLDVLVTSRMHDVKPGRMASATAEHWAYALVSLQTIQGFSGRGNYGVARMKGGYGNRSCIAAAPGTWAGARFVRDTRVWLEQRKDIAADYVYAREGGIALLWTVPWDGAKGSGIALARLDPFFVEVCRIVRLQSRGESLVARYAPTECARIDADTEGATGDVWTVLSEDGTAFTVGPSGWSYQKLHELLLGDRQSPAQILRAEDGAAPVFYAHALVRGQGKTEGLHERVIPVPPKARAWLGTPTQRDLLGRVAKQRVDDAATVRTKILWPAIMRVIQAGKAKAGAPGKKENRPSRWTRRFDAEVDRIFFDALWEVTASANPDDTTAWRRRLLDLATPIYDDAARTVPLPSMRRLEALAAGDGVFHSLTRKCFPELFNTKEEPPHANP